MLKYIMNTATFMLNGVIVLTLVMLAHTTTIAQGETKIFQPERIEKAVIVTEDDYKQFPDLIVSKEANCLALNTYYEARSDNLAGQYAVADVVLNRVNDNRYPNTICDVIYEGPVKESWKTRGKKMPDKDRIYNPIRNMCQFSWYCDGKDDIPDDETGWAVAQYVAGSILYANKHRGLTEGATHYHATYVKPKWTKDRGMNLVGRIGSHIFYRWD